MLTGVAHPPVVLLEVPPLQPLSAGGALNGGVARITDAVVGSLGARRGGGGGGGPPHGRRRRGLPMVLLPVPPELEFVPVLSPAPFAAVVAVDVAADVTREPRRRQLGRRALAAPEQAAAATADSLPTVGEKRGQF